MLKWFPEFRLENSYRGNSYSYFHMGFPSSNYLIIDFMKVLYCFVCFVCLLLKLGNKNALCCYIVTEDWFIKANIPLLTVTSNRCLGKENKKYSSDKKILLVRFWYVKLQRSYRPGFDFFFSPPGLSGFNKEAEGSLGVCLKMMSTFLLIHPSLWRISCHWWRRKYVSWYRYDKVMILKTEEHFRVGLSFLDGCYSIFYFYFFNEFKK